MEIYEAIRNRRSIGKVKPDSVDRAVIEMLLEAATWAPNHHHTEPWKFFVLTGEGRRPLGSVLAEIAREEMKEPDTDENQYILRKQEEKAFRAPVVIAAVVTPSDNQSVIEIEEIGAVSAAIQNLLLAAHAQGLGAVWRTGKPTYHPKMKELFCLNEGDTMLGFIYIGYPDMEQPQSNRTHFKEKTIWISEA